jgi:phage shock protein PspC (stress-responsive transcriptional regulator)
VRSREAGMTVEKRLTRPRNDRWIAGVCSGVARYFGLDPTLIRVLWVLFVCLGGSGILAYVICWIVMPNEE